MGELFNINDKVIVITGGTGVLGSVIASYLAKEGAKIVILGRRKEAGEKQVEEIEKKGGKALFLTTDVMNEKLLIKNREEILAHYGRIDALLNAAGGNMSGANIPPDKTIFDLDIDQFDKVVRLNLTGSVLPSQVFLLPMVEQKKELLSTFLQWLPFGP